jgi:hypothetical protein
VSVDESDDEIIERHLRTIGLRHHGEVRRGDDGDDD